MTDQCRLKSESLFITIILQEENEFASQLLRDKDSEAVRAVLVTDSTKDIAPTARISKIDNIGQVTVQFSKNMYTEFMSQVGNKTEAVTELPSQRRELNSEIECRINATTEPEFWSCVKDEILRVELM